MLSLQHATIGYGRNIILEDASFELRPKSICGLVAPNGFGKTTLLRALSGTASLMKHGSVVLDGESVYARQDVRTKLFFGPSDESLLYPQKTGTFHLKLVQELWESGAESGTAAALLGIEGFAGRPVRTYSQGMKRQLLLAMAYASQASYILLDEPLNALDPDKAERGCAALFRMAEEGASILVASHQPEELDRICDSYMVFKGTKLAVVPKQGSCRELFHRCYGKDTERRG
jgi:ABC-2 type transport system ATP-binding protein